VVTKALLQVLLTVIGSVVAVWIMVPFIVKRFPTAENTVEKAHDVVDELADFGEVIAPEYASTFDLIKSIADTAVQNAEQLIKVGTLTDKAEAERQAVDYIESVLALEGFDDEFLNTNRAIIEGTVRAAVYMMNFWRDHQPSVTNEEVAAQYPVA
jgi:hypothetical protein